MSHVKHLCFSEANNLLLIKNAAINTVNMIWKMHQNINVSTFCFSVNVIIKHNKRWKQQIDPL